MFQTAINALLKSRKSRGFSFPELLLAVALLGILVTIGVISMTPNFKTITSSRLETDVLKLNQQIGVFLAQGGSLDGITTAQGVLDKLKSTLSDTQTRTQVGVMTGRSVDVRMAARTVTSAQRTSGSPAVVWNSAAKRFEVVTSGTVPANAISEFYLDDALASNNYGTVAVAKTNVSYNADAGWIWSAENAATDGGMTPLLIAQRDTYNALDAGISTTTTNSSTTGGSTTSSSTTSGTTTTSGSTTSSSTTSSSTTSGSTTSSSTTAGTTTGTLSSTPLPTPVINPRGGIFFDAMFPDKVYLNSNGAPPGSSVMKYRLNGTGDWIVYTDPIPVTSGTRVEAKSFSTDPTLYTDSGIRIERYYSLTPAFTGLVTARWNASTGPNSMVVSIDNSNPDNVVEQDGTASTSSTAGRNSFAFRRSPTFTNVPPNTDFVIGQISYKNGTIVSGTGATGLNLRLDITMTAPGVASTPADIRITLENTVNNGVSDEDDADLCILANPVTNYAINVGGVIYTLVIRYGTISATQGFVRGYTLGVFEGYTGTVDIIARFVASTPPP